MVYHRKHGGYIISEQRGLNILPIVRTAQKQQVLNVLSKYLGTKLDPDINKADLIRALSDTAKARTQQSVAEVTEAVESAETEQPTQEQLNAIAAAESASFNPFLDSLNPVNYNSIAPAEASATTKAKVEVKASKKAAVKDDTNAKADPEAGNATTPIRLLARTTPDERDRKVAKEDTNAEANSGTGSSMGPIRLLARAGYVERGAGVRPGDRTAGAANRT